MYKNITENFKWYEFFKSQVAKRKGIPNMPREGIVYVNIKELVDNVLQPIRNLSIDYIDIIEWIHNNCSYRELIAEYFPEGWIHVAYTDDMNNRQLKLKDESHNYERVSLNKIKELYG